VVKYAEKYSVDAVLCGHIHSVAIHKFGDVTYYNCGDWVETCSAMVEREDGVIEIVTYGAPGAARSMSALATDDAAVR
jgi:UDP-2,3-diacylglucosamine pyrophosphatase LpxH